MSAATQAEAAGPSIAVRWTRYLSRIALRWVVLVALIGSWQLATVNLSSPYWVPPFTILERVAQLWLPSGEGILSTSMAQDVLPSLARMLVGFLLAMVLAIAVGVAIGLSDAFGDYVNPILQFLRAAPPPALIPVFLVVFGTGDQMRIFLIAFGAAWPILLNTIEGVRSIEPIKYETSEVFRIPLRLRLTHIVLPGAAAKILAGVRTSLSIGLILMVISEMVASSSGIGFRIVQAQRSFALVDMWAGILLLAILGYLLNQVLTVVERRILRWHRLAGHETS
ncbi:ABC transporter permease [Micromonospora sp. NPDC003776]